MRRLIVPLLLIFNIALSGGAPAAFKGPAPDNPRMLAAGSPYLALHANDLVRWHAWGDEAFVEAERTNKPVLVSFGYTACHWCHVMQEKHFNDASMARFINDNFVPVLVDRERRTSLDDTYMLVTELLTQRGGWPNTVFMTADRKPFYGTGYVPPGEFQRILSIIAESWETEQPAMLAEAERLSSALSGYLTRKEAAVKLTPGLLEGAASSLAKSFDPQNGGFGDGPRFMRPPILKFLLQQAEKTGNAEILAAAERTLQAALHGGIQDHLAGGFHRYTVDPGWRVPHFEKMLNDQALIAEVYLSAYRITGKHEYAATARRTLDYVLGDLMSPQGAFYTARDAASEGAEGTFYVWTPAQLVDVLGRDDAQFAVDTFQVIGEGDLEGKVVINRDAVRGQSVPRVEKILRLLQAARRQRSAPVRDEKILANWNGLMISSLAKAAVILREKRYGEAAARAASFIWSNMRCAEGRLHRSRYAGSNALDGELDDHALMVSAMLDLYDWSQDTVWLDRSKQLADVMTGTFADADNGDFFGTRQASGIARIKPRSDLDQPSGNGAAALALVRLAQRAATPARRRQAEAAIDALSGIAAKSASTGGTALFAASSFNHGQTGPVQYAGGGVVRASVSPDPGRQALVVKLDVADGWHVNAHQPLQDFLIGTDVRPGAPVGPDTVSVAYPEPVIKTLPFNDRPMALHEGTVHLRVHFDTPQAGVMDLAVRLQACSQRICLLPETLNFRLPM